MGRILRFINLFRKDLLVLLMAFFNPRTPKKIKGLFLVALIYLFSPIDLIPDAIPLAGIIDDAIIVPTLVSWLMGQLPRETASECEARADSANRKFPLIAAGAAAIFICWLALIVAGIVALIMWIF